MPIDLNATQGAVPTPPPYANPDRDLCVCGDRRDQHQNGMGACKLNDQGHLGAPACQSFRLASHAPE